ncbi:MAG: excinuclease ABC subunit UvrA [Bacteroidales bacterium]|nr:excinuclease ABC subunit UvrA [Bacteroidales bacterium]
MSVSNIVIKGARVNNLKNVDVEIPRNELVVVTGLSGSGKSSLAFDTLYAEGRRRYVESLSAYARQFMGKLRKPECDFIRGLPPAIAIEQKVNTRNPRSTVGTSTEIYDYMRMLFGRIGRTYSPVSGELVKKHSVEDILAAARSYPEGTRVAVTAPIRLPEGRTLAEQLGIYVKEGYSRVVDAENNFIDISEYDASAGVVPELLIDRLSVAHSGDEFSRLADSAETAFFEGHDECTLIVWTPEGEVVRHPFSKRFEADGITFTEVSEQMFNFNNPMGACPVCEGFGRTLDIAENLVIPNAALSLFDGAVAPWRGPSSAKWRTDFIHNAKDFDIHTPYNKLSAAQRKLLWEGDGKKVRGINDYFDEVASRRAAIEFRMILARYRGKTTCRACGGTRLRPEASYVKVGGATITELVTLPVNRLLDWFRALELDERDSKIAERLLTEITKRLTFLVDIGLGYLTLDRLSNSLSGGESQRINLATSLGSSLVGSLYILDEPSIGLHSRDTERLIGVLRKLQKLGNTVVVVEHDEDIMRAADRIIDVGPAAGTGGGNIVFQGKPSDIVGASDSFTMKYLTGQMGIDVPAHRRPWRDYIRVNGATEHNLKDVTVDFPLGVMTCVTGVSGSGKSTLVRDILCRALTRQYLGEGDAPGAFTGLTGDIKRMSGVVFVDQNPIGRSSRSNPATYLKAYDEIRTLMASQQAAKQMDIPAGYFSFNAEGGRCEACKGEGHITVEMQFLADVTIECEECHGKRFKRDVLEVKYRDKNIYDILEMTVDDAIDFFGQGDGATEKRIVQRLKPLHDVGLGYIKLGQSSSTLSGGENQRVKLAYFLAQGKAQPQIFIFDEPTTGLHFHDIHLLLKAFDDLIKLGHTLIVVEHNLDVIKCADHIIDLGPDGGDAGGTIVATGTPEEVAANDKSVTGRFLKDKLS